MATGYYETLEVRFIIEPELMQVYVFMQADAECPIGVQGWHHKTFGKSVSTLDVLNLWAKGEDNPVYWPLSAPKER